VRTRICVKSELYVLVLEILCGSRICRGSGEIFFFPIMNLSCGSSCLDVVLMFL